MAIAAAAHAQPPADPHAPFPPFKIGEGLYYVGADDYASFLIVARAGLIVIDGGDAVVGKQVVKNIRDLGFDPAQVKILLNSHEHFDHAGGLAEIKRAAPGAKFYASAADGATTGSAVDHDLAQALTDLAPKQRHAVAYHYLAGLPYDEVAAIIGGTTEAARRAAADGIASLRRSYPDLVALGRETA